MPGHVHVAKQKNESGVGAHHRAPRTPDMSGQPPLHHIIQRAETDFRSLTPADVLALQRTLGNRAVTQLLRPGGSTTASQGSTAIVQRALQVGAADDPFEREAEDFAEQMIRRAPTPASHPAGNERIGDPEEPIFKMQQLVESRDGAADPDPVVGRDGGDIGADLEAGIRTMRGSGRPLDQEWRVSMEEATRHDYSDVRLHVNAESDRLNAQLGARAFTVGKDIFMKSREYRPGSPETRKLAFHEMVHVGHQTDRPSPGEGPAPTGLGPRELERSQRGQEIQIGGRESHLFPL